MFKDLRCFASTSSVGGSSKLAPSEPGVQLGMWIPLGTIMKSIRTGLSSAAPAALDAAALAAATLYIGDMASSQGRAIAVPNPRMTVRRSSCLMAIPRPLFPCDQTGRW